MEQVNEGWDEIINHLLDDVGMKELKFEIEVKEWGGGSGNFSTCDTYFAIFNNGFRARYSWAFHYVYPAEDYDPLLVISKKTWNKFDQQVKILEAEDKQKKQKERARGLVKKSSFIKEWYAKKWGQND